MSTEFCEKYFARLRAQLDAFDTAAFAKILDLLLDAQAHQRQVFVFGNGGSAAAASHFVADINKGVSLGLAKRFRMTCLNDNIPIMLAYANDVSYDEIFVGQLQNFLDEGDLVIGYSGSGNSKNVLKAVDYARTHKAKTVGVSGFDGGKLAKLVDVALVTPVNDMQNVEDMQSVINHLLMRGLMERLG
ncbi:MAG: SIS domain-containing protein [Deltaproteobacteria bacterium]|nr:SIS domain-containing protein [Deltaproteobacteria bacterium]